MAKRLTAKTVALSYRTAPPQVGRSTRGGPLAISDVEIDVMSARPADLPPCGGDARQGRGGKPHTPSYPVESF